MKFAKVLLMLFMVILLLFCVQARAEKSQPGFDWNKFNLGGDIHYVINDGLNYGAGYHIGQFNEILGLRASLIGPNWDEVKKAGIGLDVNIPKLLEQTFGFKWELGSFNPTLGISTGTDFVKLIDGGGLWDSSYISWYLNIFRFEFGK